MTNGVDDIHAAKFSNEVGDRSVELFKEDAVLLVYPSVKLGIRVRTEALNAQGAEWVTLDALTSFFSDLEELEKMRKGTAELRSMSPDALTVTISITDKAGHAAVSAELRRPAVFEGGLGWSASVRFEIDPSLIPRTITDLSLVLASLR
jgi:hypothetical protein